MTHRANLVHAADGALARLVAVYGREFSTKYEALDHDALRDSLMHEVGRLPDVLDRIAWALDNLPGRCPNLAGFRELCERAAIRRADEQRAQQVQPAAPEVARRVRESFDRRRRPSDDRDWARRLIARHESGEHMATPVVLAMAREAVAVPAAAPRLPEDEEAALAAPAHLPRPADVVEPNCPNKPTEGAPAP